MRVDKLLWNLRLVRSRTVAQVMAEEGHMRVNGRRIDRAHQKIGVGDVLTIFAGREVQVLEVLTLPVRRGPYPEARAHYRVLDGGGTDPIAAGATEQIEEGFSQP